MIRCHDCLPKHLFCNDCDLSVHQNYVLHNRDSVVEGFYKALPPTCYIVQDGSVAHQLCEQGMSLMNFYALSYYLFHFNLNTLFY